jgi:hypothetical protein
MARKIQGTLLAGIATALSVSAVVLGGAQPAFAATGQDVAALARANLAKHYCDVNSLGGRGFETSCKPEKWCADFAKWVWRNNGLVIDRLTAESGTFYTYGERNGTLHASAGYQPQVGDAVVFEYHGGGDADHVGLVSQVYAGGGIQVINGNFGPTPTTSSVQYSQGTGAVGQRIAGQRISAFVTPVGLNGPGGPVQVRPDGVNQVSGDGWSDLVGIDANGELFGYNNASLTNPSHTPFTGESWRIAGSNWTGAKFIAAADVSGDGYADLVGAMNDGSLVVYANGSQVNYDGLPYVGETWRYQGNWGSVQQFAVGDVTGDGYADLVAVASDGALSIYANGLRLNGTPFGAETWHIPGNWSGVRQLSVADLNNDGYADIVAVDANGELFGYHNGTLVNPNHVPFTSQTWRMVGSNWSSVRQLTTGEATGDTYSDLIAVEADGSMSIYANGILNTPSTPFTARTWSIPGNWTSVRHLA